jgi:hypothetical protein
MVDLSAREAGNKKQRAFHMDDATHERLQKAAELSSSTMSQVLTRLVWEDLHLPDDAPSMAPVDPARLTKVGERIAETQAMPAAATPARDPASITHAGRVPTQADIEAQRKRLRGHHATKLDGSDQRERDPTNDGKGGDSFDI